MENVISEKSVYLTYQLLDSIESETTTRIWLLAHQTSRNAIQPPTALPILIKQSLRHLGHREKKRSGASDRTAHRMALLTSSLEPIESINPGKCRKPNPIVDRSGRDHGKKLEESQYELRFADVVGVFVEQV